MTSSDVHKENASRTVALKAAPTEKRRMHAHVEAMAEHLRRKPETLTLTAQIAGWAEQSEVESLTERFASLPLRVILAVRANLLEDGLFRTVVGTLIRGLEHPSPTVRFRSAGALDHMADESCLEALRRALEDPVKKVRRAALHSLTCEDCKVARQEE